MLPKIDGPNPPDFDDDRYWQNGTYRNPNDPRFYVPKRFGVPGITVNFAHFSADAFASRKLGAYLLVSFVVLAMALYLTARLGGTGYMNP